MKRTNRVVCLLLAALMVLSVLPVTVFAANTKTYLALGDSISGGYGLESLDQAFPTLIAQALGEDYTLTNLALNGETAESLSAHLQETEYQEAVKDAHVITITIGGNDLMEFFYQFLADNLGMDIEDVKQSLADGDEDVLAQCADVINEKGFSLTQAQFQAVSDSFAATMAQIRSLNDRAVVIITTQYNPYDKLAAEVEQYSFFLSGDTKELADAIIKVSANIETILATWNRSIQESAGADYLVADVYTAFSQSSENLCNAKLSTNPISVDLDFHPNQAGHQVIAQVILEVMPELEEPSLYTVTFDLQGHGRAIDPVTAVEGSTISAPAAPAEAGFLFGGWYRDSACTNPWNFDTDTVTADLTLYAQWTACDHSGSTSLPDCENAAACSVCGGTMDALGHDFESSSTWLDTNPDGHCKLCIRCDGADLEHLEAHVFASDSDAQCDVCGYNRTIPTFQLTFETGEGTPVEPVEAVSGTTIDLTGYTSTRQGFTFTGWYLDADCTQAVSAVTLTEHRTVYAGWEEITEPVSNPFQDVAESDWFYEDVMFVYEAGLMNGTDPDLFSPHLTTTRGMIVAILYRLEGNPQVAASGTFQDVRTDMYYAPAIEWAAANDIVNGYGDGLFGPEDPITREQMAAILWRYAGYAGLDLSSGENTDLSSYADAAAISDYAVDAMKWVVSQGIIGGYDGQLHPAGNAKRSEVAAILHRYCLLVEG